MNKVKAQSSWAPSLFLFILVISAFLFLIPVGPVFASCSGSGTKYNATALDNDYTSNTIRGTYGVNIPISVSLCGSSFSEGSYIHMAPSTVTSSGGGWIEAPWYFGYNDYGSSSTTYPALEWLKYNFWAGGRAASDVSAGTGLYPHFGDSISTTLKYDWTDAYGKDYYKIVFYDSTAAWTITITNLWTDGRGYYADFQSETFSLLNSIQAKVLIGQYMDTSNVWHTWTGYTLYQAQGGQEFCVGAVSGTTNSFKFGYYTGSVCFLP